MEDELLRVGESTQDAAGDLLRWNDGIQYDGEEEETGKLDEEMREISERLRKYRTTLPGQFTSTLSSILVSQRSISSISSDNGFEPGPSRGFHQGLKSNSNDSKRMLSTDDEKAEDNVELLRDKISNNISAMPIILDRINECISRIDELVSSNETVHPGFKWKKS